MSKFLNANQTVSAIKAFGHRRTIVIQGENGIGKTAIFHMLKHMPEFKGHIAVDPIDCTQLSDGSVWMPDIDRERGVSSELPNERFGVHKGNHAGIDGARPVMVFLDEIAKAPQYIKNYLAPVVYERRVGNYHMPEGSLVICATNLGIEGLGDNIAAHLRNRVTIVYMRKPTSDEWRQQYALPARIHEVIVGFAHEHPEAFDSFLDYEPGGKYADKKSELKSNGMIFNPREPQEAYCTPRSLSAASAIVEAYMDGLIDDDTLEMSLDGTVGPATRANLAAYIRFGQQTIDVADIFADPEKALVSANPSVQFMQAMKLLRKVTDRPTANAASLYVTRLKGELQAMFVNDVAKSNLIVFFATVQPFQALLQRHSSKF